MANVKTEAIVLRTLRYSESHLIAHLYTKEKGYIGVIAPYAYKSKKRVLKPAFFQPLTLLNAIHSQSSEHKSKLERLKEVTLAAPLKTVHQNIFKNTMAIFLGELLEKILKEREKDLKLFEFLKKMILHLDTIPKCGHFHIFFLIRLSSFLGFHPDTEGIEKGHFNLKEGYFEEVTPTELHLNSSILQEFKAFLKTDVESYQSIPLGGKSRKELLYGILHYYQRHIGQFSTPKSLKVLEDVFMTK